MALPLESLSSSTVSLLNTSSTSGGSSKSLSRIRGNLVILRNWTRCQWRTTCTLLLSSLLSALAMMLAFPSASLTRRFCTCPLVITRLVSLTARKLPSRTSLPTISVKRLADNSRNAMKFITQCRGPCLIGWQLSGKRKLRWNLSKPYAIALLLKCFVLLATKTQSQNSNWNASLRLILAQARSVATSLSTQSSP